MSDMPEVDKIRKQHIEESAHKIIVGSHRDMVVYSECSQDESVVSKPISKHAPAPMRIKVWKSLESGYDQANVDLRKCDEHAVARALEILSGEPLSGESLAERKQSFLDNPDKNVDFTIGKVQVYFTREGFGNCDIKILAPTELRQQALFQIEEIKGNQRDVG